jgi:hypothetical protein
MVLVAAIDTRVQFPPLLARLGVQPRILSVLRCTLVGTVYRLARRLTRARVTVLPSALESGRSDRSDRAPELWNVTLFSERLR